ncbi:MAG: MarC family protein [Desulfurococcaceae archaeon]
MFETLVNIILIFMTYFIQLFAIMNPFSVIPTYLALTQSISADKRKEIIKKAWIAGMLIVLVFTLAGHYILQAFNVSIAGLRVGGGILLITIALDMLGDEVRTKRVHPSDIAVVPIATPLLIGPGTITTILLLTSAKPGDAFNIVLVLIAGLTACGFSFFLLKISDNLVKYLKLSTVRAVGRFMALIIAGVAVEMIVKGLHTYYISYFKS